MTEVALPKSLYAIVLSSVLNDIDLIEHCLVLYPEATGQCLPHALYNMLSSLASKYHLAVPVFSSRDSLSMLQIMWSVPARGRYDALVQTVNHELIYLLPYIFILPKYQLQVIGSRTLRPHDTFKSSPAEMLSYGSYHVMYQAVSKRNSELLKLLILYAASENEVDKVNDIREAILPSAVKHHHPLDTIKFLVRPLSLANAEVPFLLDKHTNLLDHALIYDGEFTTIKWLLEEKADISGTSALARFTACTPLSLAANAGRLDIINLLLEAKSDVNAVHGCALSRTVARGRIDMVDRLLMMKADVYQHTPNIAKALLDCDEEKVGQIFPLLLNPRYGQPGININYNNGYPLKRAVRDCNLTVTKLLLDAGADIDQLPDTLESSHEMRNLLGQYGY